MEFTARYQDGNVATSRDVTCIIDLASDPVMLAILDAGTREIVDRWSADECYLLHSRMMELRIGNRQRAVGARLAVTGIENMKAALGVLPKLNQHQRTDYWKQARIITLATAALLLGPLQTGLDPTAHAYPATVWLLSAWTAVHVAVGVLMLLYCMARRVAGRMTATHDIDIRNATLYWHFVAITLLVTVATIAGFPLLA